MDICNAFWSVCVYEKLLIGLNVGLLTVMRGLLSQWGML